MFTFERVEASCKSVKMRRPLYEVGVNDAWYTVSKKIDGKLYLCPIYRAWANMLMRCYRREYKEKHPSYNGCYVCDEWLTFSSFYAWAKSKIGDGLDLDKDILVKGNKVYSPSKCIFVTKEINYIILGKRFNSKYKQGVSWCKRDSRFVAYMSIEGKSKNLGSFLTEDGAYSCYLKNKKERVVAVAKKQKDKALKCALINYAYALE